MSTRHSDLGNVQGVPPRESQSIYTTDTVQHAKASPPGSFPPPRPPTRSRRNFWFAVAAVVIAVLLIISVVTLVLVQ